MQILYTLYHYYKVFFSNALGGHAAYSSSYGKATLRDIVTRKENLILYGKLNM